MSFSFAIEQAVLATCLTASLLVAQKPFADLARRGMPRDLESVTSAVFGDVDGDGDVDLILGIDGLFPQGTASLLLNDGAGHYQKAAGGSLPKLWMSPADLALGDLDGDGDLDLVVGNRSNLQNLLLINDGTGRFTDATAAQLPKIFDDTRAVVLADLDADGDLDLVICNDLQPNVLLINDGSGKFSVQAALPSFALDQSLDVAVSDIDGDGDVDLVVANGAGQNRLLFNDGSGKFVDVTSANLPTDLDPTVAVVSLDVDGDSDMDLVFGNYEKPGLLYLNNGKGQFTRGTTAPLSDGPPVASFCAVDVDGDQDADILVGLWGAPNRLLINKGGGVFTAQVLNSDADPTQVVQSADIDRDGDMDLFSGNSFSVFVPNRSALYLNDGGVFVDTAQAHLPADTDESEGVATGDLDGDGLADFVVANYETRNRVYRARLDGFFVDDTARALPVDRDRSRTVCLGDVDGDGDLDLIVGNELQDRLYLNDGTGKFTDVTSTSMPRLTGDTRDCALADVDGDGDLDLVLAMRGLTPSNSLQNRLYTNDGAGRFTDATTLRLPAFRDFTEAVSLGDVDGDGDVDIVFGNRDIGLSTAAQINRLLYNDGKGTFRDVTVTNMPLILVPTTDLALVDVDGDADLDLVISNWILPDSLYLNVNGKFTVSPVGQFPLVSDRSVAVAVGDLDEDGDQDLVFGVSGAPDAVYWNDGSGRFLSASSVPFRASSTAQIALADFDGDGDLDCIAVHTSSEPNQLFLNTRRQLDAPYMAILGGELRFEVLVRPVPNGGARSVLPWIGLSTASAAFVVQPFGRFTIDPATIVALPSSTLGATSGRVVASLPLPLLPALAGLKVLGQAAVWHSGSNSGRVTNTVSLTIHR